MKVASLLALLACCACGSNPAPPAGALWTTFDFVAAQKGSRFDGQVTQAGQPLRLLSAPFSSTVVNQDPATPGLTVFPAFSEGRPAAYVTTEIWEQFPRIWVQPLYVPVQSYDANGPVFYPSGDSVFGIDATSRFYSPYWQVYYFVTDKPNTYRSAKAILDAGFELHEGPGKFCAISPEGLGPAQPAGAAGPVRPLSGEAIGAPAAGQAYVDGHRVYYVDLGNDRFRWDPVTKVVTESALFGFAVRGASGEAALVDLPKVGGTGPLFSGIPALAPGGRPQFGGLWHLYSVLLPKTAAVYVPSGKPALRASVEAQGLAAPPPPAGRDGDDALTLKVAADKACFATAAAFDACTWLDSQAQIEAQVADFRLEDTGLRVSCPLLLYKGKAVGVR